MSYLMFCLFLFAIFCPIQTFSKCVFSYVVCCPTCTFVKFLFLFYCLIFTFSKCMFLFVLCRPICTSSKCLFLFVRWIDFISTSVSVSFFYAKLNKYGIKVRPLSVLFLFRASGISQQSWRGYRNDTGKKETDISQTICLD